MKKLVEYILEKQGYVDLEDFVDDIMKTIVDDSKSRLREGFKKHLNSSIELIEDTQYGNKSQLLHDIKRIINDIREKISKDNFTSLKYEFKKSQNKNPGWLDKLYIVGMFEDDVVSGALSLDETVFNDNESYATIYLSLFNNFRDIFEMNCRMTMDEINIDIQHIDKAKISDILQTSMRRYLSSDPLMDREKKTTLIHELSHAYDLYIISRKNSNYLYKSITTDYVSCRGRKPGEYADPIRHAGYMINQSELNAEKQEIIYACENGALDRRSLNDIYKLFSQARNRKWDDKLTSEIKFACNIHYSIELIGDILANLINFAVFVQNDEIWFQNDNINEILRNIDETRVFKIYFKLNKNLETREELIHYTNKLIDLYIEKFTNILKTAAKHLVK